MLRPLETNQRGWLTLWVFLGGMGAAAGTAPRLLQPAASASTPTAPAAASPEPETGIPPDTAAKLRPVLTLLGESLGVGPESGLDGAVRAAKILQCYLQQAKPPQPSWHKESLRTVRAQLDLLVAGKGTTKAFTTSEQVLALQHLTLPVKDLPGGSEVAAARKELLGYVRQAQSDETLRLNLQDRARKLNIAVDFVVAGIADYVDSNIGWVADQQLEVIQSALAESGFTLDRFYLPEWSKEARGEAAASHRESPGAIIFRDRAPAQRLRVVLTVPETPTSGLHRESLQAAFTLARSWDEDTDAPPPLRFLGPSFSGSAISLRRALEDDPSIWNRRKVHIVTGGASDALIRGQLTADTTFVTLDSTTPSLRESLSVLKRFLQEIHPQWAEGRHMAILHESNTMFGSGAAPEPGKPKNFFGDETYIPFPLHVSRVRDATAQVTSSLARPSIVPRILLPLVARDSTKATDQLPSLTPDLTGASVQTAMSALFQALRRDRFQIVLIVATDERDVLYLAREVRRTAPDVQLVFFRANMLHFHPDYASYTRGTLVVTPYALTSATSRWGVNFNTDNWRPFQSSVAESLYNATLLLTGQQAKMLDYGVAMDPQAARPPTPGAVASGPPIWINVIGRTGYAPLKAYPALGQGHLSAQWHAKGKPLAAEAIGASYSLPSILLLCAFAAAVGWHLVSVLQQVVGVLGRRTLLRDACMGSASRLWVRLTYRAERNALAAHARRLRRFKAPKHDWDEWKAAIKGQRVSAFRRVFVLPWAPRDVRGTARLFVHAAFALLGLLGAWWVVLAMQASGALTMGLPMVAAVAITATPLLLWATDYKGTPPKRPAGAHAQGYVFAGALAMVLVGSLFLVAMALQPPADAKPEDLLPLSRMLFAERGLSLVSLVSPTVPVTFLALTGYAWCIWQLRVLSLVGDGYVGLFRRKRVEHAVEVETVLVQTAGGGPVERCTTATIPVAPTEPLVSMTSALLSGELAPARPNSAVNRWRPAFTSAFDATLPTRERWRPFAVAAVLTAIVAPLVVSRVVTFEGTRFTWLFRVATLGGLFLSTLALAQTWAQWRQVASVLRRLGRSPLAPAFKRVRSFQLDWRLNLKLPRLDELTTLMRETDALEATLRQAAAPPDDVAPLSERALRERTARELLRNEGLVPDSEKLVAKLLEERHTEVLRLLNSESFRCVWRRTERYLPLLNAWRDAQARIPDKVPEGPKGDKIPPTAMFWGAVGWLERAENAVALTLAFVIRDLLSRIVAGLSVSCLCFVLLLVSHLLYSFPGRSTMLIVDWIGVGVSGALAVIVLVAMERSVVLSHLWDSTPGRISFNRDFVQRLALYGALPVLTLVSALFPEMGDTIFGWLAPARQLAGF